MENEHWLLTPIAARRRLRPLRDLAQEKVLDAGGSVDVDGTRNVAAFILIIETAVDDMESDNTRIILAVKEVIDL